MIKISFLVILVVYVLHVIIIFTRVLQTSFVRKNGYKSINDSSTVKPMWNIFYIFRAILTTQVLLRESQWSKKSTELNFADGASEASIAKPCS